MIRWNSIQKIFRSKEEFLEYGVVLFSVLFFGLTAAIIVAIGVSVYRKVRYKETL